MQLLINPQWSINNYQSTVTNKKEKEHKFWFNWIILRWLILQKQSWTNYTMSMTLVFILLLIFRFSFFFSFIIYFSFKFSFSFSLSFFLLLVLWLFLWLLYALLLQLLYLLLLLFLLIIHFNLLFPLLLLIMFFLLHMSFSAPSPHNCCCRYILLARYVTALTALYEEYNPIYGDKADRLVVE